LQLRSGYGCFTPGQQALPQFEVLLLSQALGRFQFPAALGQQRRRVSSIPIHRPQERQGRVEPLVVVVVDDLFWENL